MQLLPKLIHHFLISILTSFPLICLYSFADRRHQSNCDVCAAEITYDSGAFSAPQRESFDDLSASRNFRAVRGREKSNKDILTHDIFERGGTISSKSQCAFSISPFSLCPRKFNCSNKYQLGIRKQSTSTVQYTWRQDKISTSAHSKWIPHTTIHFPLQLCLRQLNN
jgi:hypothetical protein